MSDFLLNLETAENVGVGNVLNKLLDTARNEGASAFWKRLEQFENEVEKLSPAEYSAWRAEIKRECPKINVGELDKLIKGGGGSGGDRVSPAQALTNLAESLCELWHNEDGWGMASFNQGGDETPQHREHWPIESHRFREWLAWLGYSRLGTPPSGETLKAVANALSGKAKFEGEEHGAFRRVASVHAGDIWIDLGDDRWRAVRVNAEGWQVVDNPPVRFIRSKSTSPMPIPAQDGIIENLWGLTNVPEGERPLVLAWLMEALRPGTPYALLEITGEQGCAKSTTQAILRGFVDANQIPLRGKPKSVEDCYVAARNNHVLSLENLSSISIEMSDAFCAITTGAGYASRQLYTNGEEALMKAHCPIILNGISQVVTRPDLLDRTVSLVLPVVTDRRSEKELWSCVEKKSPGIMGAILDRLSAALRELPNVQIPKEKLPRMADFTLLGEAMMRSMGGAPGEFLRLYTEHRKTAIERTLDASPVATAIFDYVDRGESYNGTVKGFLAMLTSQKPEHEANEYWPRSPKGLADALRRYAPALRQLGITVKISEKRQRDGVHCKVHATVSEEGEEVKTKVHDVHNVQSVYVEEF